MLQRVGAGVGRIEEDAGVRLDRVGQAVAVVVGVRIAAHAVAVRIARGVVAGAQIHRVATAVAVRVIQQVERADIADVPDAVAVSVGLVGIRGGGAVVRAVQHAVAVRV